MRIKAFLFVAIFLAVSSNAFAIVHSIGNNSSSEFVLHDGDSVQLSNLPSDWGFSRVVLGINSVSNSELFGQFVVNGCSYKLDDFYKQIDFVYKKDVSAIYNGPTQNVLVQGWVDAAPVVAKCENVESELNKDSVWQSQKNEMNFVFGVKTAGFKELGSSNVENTFAGSTSQFKITALPNWNYNRIYVQIESEDGRNLNGSLYSEFSTQKLDGKSINVPLKVRYNLPVVFELAFPEFRKVKLKWWAVMDSPKEEIIKFTEISVDSNVVEATYSFENTMVKKRNATLKFHKNDFVDGKIPTVKKFDINPDGVINIDSLKSYETLVGDVYEIHAELKNSSPITFALPLDETFNPDVDSVSMMHQVNGKWLEVPVDSIVNGFVYFRTNSFSKWYERALRKTKNFFVDAGITYGCNTLGPFSYVLSEGCRDAAGNVVRGTATTLKHFADYIKEFGVDLVCADKDGFKRLFGISEESENKWDDVDAGSLNFNDVLPDLGYNKVLKMLEEVRTRPLARLDAVDSDPNCNDHKEACEWEYTKNNMDVLLADAILAQRADGTKRRFDKASYDKNASKVVLHQNKVDLLIDDNVVTLNEAEYSYKDYFKNTSPFVEYSGWFIRGLQQCGGAFNFSGNYIQKWVDFSNSFKNYTKACRAFYDALDLPEQFADVTEKGIDCTEFVAQNIERDYSIMDGHEGKLIAVSEAMVRVSMLAWLDKEVYREFMRLEYQKAYDGISTWLELADAFLMKNNIVAKAYAGLALYEYVFTGGKSNYNSLDAALKKHYGDNGGFSEGMGYSQYIWDDVPYVLSALKKAYSSKTENLVISENFLKSPDYIFEFSRPVGTLDLTFGRIPVEVDDGCTYNPDYRVWANLKNDSKYITMSENAPLTTYDDKNVLIPFGFPDKNLYSSKKSLPDHGAFWGSNKDGLLMITAIGNDNSENKDTVALSMIAESGKMWENGQAHDQQDNLSITLTSSKKGFIIQDRGYSGFNFRMDNSKNGLENRGDALEATHVPFHRYENHNVVYPMMTSHPDNKAIPTSEITSRLENFTHKFSGIGNTFLSFVAYVWNKLWNTGHDGKYDLTVEGGYKASIDDHVVDNYSNGSIGFTATTYFKYPEYGDNSVLVQNKRSILYFGGNFWVIDRPEIGNLMWYMNSPISTWNELNDVGLRLYGSSPSDVKNVDNTFRFIIQNHSRADYPEKQMKNFAYSVHDGVTKTFVMTYSVNDENFEKVTENCPENYQCFKNGANDKRLIVPPFGEKFKLCDVLPQNECSSGDGKSSGITMFVKKTSDTWVTDKNLVLDGKLTNVENGIEVEMKSVILARTAFSYSKLDGAVVSGKHQSSYLPANIILLRQ